MNRSIFIYLFGFMFIALMLQSCQTESAENKKIIEESAGEPSAAPQEEGVIQPVSSTPEVALDPLAAQKEAQQANGPKTTMKFATYEHDFGTIKQDSENKFVFTFTNTGKEPLVIESAKGSCGCTVPEYPKEPIAPGKTGEINVSYKPGKQRNQQTKKVTITANTDPVQTILTIKANVEAVE